MYSISNSQREELTKLLAALTSHPAVDTKAFNIQRRAKLAINKLNRAQKLTEHNISNLNERKVTT